MKGWLETLNILLIIILMLSLSPLNCWEARGEEVETVKGPAKELQIYRGVWIPALTQEILSGRKCHLMSDVEVLKEDGVNIVGIPAKLVVNRDGSLNVEKFYSYLQAVEETVTFRVARWEAGLYQVEVGDLHEEFQVKTFRFGFVGGGASFIPHLDLGFKWDRPHPGPFIWGKIEPSKGVYDLSKTDLYVQSAQNHEIQVMATIWPYAEWDQEYWRQQPGWKPSQGFEGLLPESRYKPHDVEAYKAFVKTLVERYDGDGVNDMPGLRQPIKYWEVLNEPEMGLKGEPLNFFRGSPADYLEIVRATYEAVKEADPEAKVLNGGIAYVPENLEEWKAFWGEFFRLGGGQYVDIITFHNLNPRVSEALERLKEYLEASGVNKPIWLTELQVAEGFDPELGSIGEEEQAELIVKACVEGFAGGIEKIFYTSYVEMPGAPESLINAALVKANGTPKKAYYAYKTMIALLEGFSSAEKLEEGLYKFELQNNLEVYVLYPGVSLPPTVTGKILTVNLKGDSRLTEAENLAASISLLFVVSGSEEALKELQGKLLNLKGEKVETVSTLKKPVLKLEKPTVKIKSADLNGDGKVDREDLKALKKVYGLSRGKAGFKVKADLNSDGKIDILDLAILAFQFKVERAKPPSETLKETGGERKPEKGMEKPKVSLTGVWEQLKGMDGGDMHFVYSTSEGILFLSHGFGGVWRSEDGGQSWKLIKQEGFADLHFYDMEESDGRLYAGSNRGLWYSEDKGETWIKIATGFEGVDSGKYHVVSLAKYQDKLFFTAVLDKAYRERKPGEGKLFCLENGEIREVEVPDSREITVSARYPYLFLSSPYSGLYVSWKEGGWVKILDKKTAKVFVDEEYDLYVGTIGDWWYLGRKTAEGWEWKQVTVPGKSSNTIFHFLVPDPANRNRLWFGCGGVATFYSFSARGFGNAFFGVGCWNGEELTNLKIHGNYATSIAFYGDETVETPCGKATKYAFVTVGGQAVQKTEDGGLTWHNSYEGVFGDTINAINPVKSGILAGSIVITAVSGTEIALDHGESWMENVDFTIGRVDGKLPGYAWCAASPDRKIKGKYDLLVSTGYPSPFGGDGVFAIDTSSLREGKKDRVERLLEGPHYEMAVWEGKLYAGNMDDGVDVLDLETFEQSKIRIDGSGVPLVRLYDGKLFLETYEGRYVGDGWRWTGSRGKIYLYEDGELRLIYDKYAINFSVKDGELIALTQTSLTYKPDILSGEVVEAQLPSKKYTDMAVDWEDGLIFLSTDGEGIFYTTINELKAGNVELQAFNDGLLTLKIRNIVYDDGCLFAGTRGYSTWRVQLQTIE